MSEEHTEETCVEHVYDRIEWRSFHCGKKAGHGRGGLYCKQHAIKNPSGDEKTETWYKFNWWGGKVVPVEVLKSTDKTLTIVGQGRVNIDGYYRTKAEAIESGIREEERVVRQCLSKIEGANYRIGNLRKMLKEEENGIPNKNS